MAAKNNTLLLKKLEDFTIFKNIYKEFVYEKS